MQEQNAPRPVQRRGLAAVGLLLIGMTWLAAPARAATNPTPESPVVQKAIVNAVQLFKQHKYKQVLQLIDTVIRQTGQNPTQLVYLTARCYEELELLSEAATAYEEFLARPDAPGEGWTKATAALIVLREKLPKGRLVFQIEPAGADVTVDGRRLGQAPLDPQGIRSGNHEIRVKADGFREGNVKVNVPPGGDAVVALRLSSLEADAMVTTNEPRRIAKRSYSPWTWITLGTGTALATVAAVCYALGERDLGKIVHDPGYDSGGIMGLTRKQALDLQASGYAKKNAGYALWGVGGAALIGSAVLFVLQAVGRPGPTTQAGPAPFAGGAGWFVNGRF